MDTLTPLLPARSRDDSDGGQVRVPSSADRFPQRACPGKKARFAALLLPLVPFVLQQESESSATWEGSVRDSAGVTVVENYGPPLWRDGEEWTLREVLRIGTVEGEPEYQFGRITNFTPMSDGRIVVSDGMAHRVRFYSPEGQHLRSVGKTGPGPKEFGEGGLLVMRSYGDTLLVADGANMQVHRLAPNGDWLGSFSTRPEGGYFVRGWDTAPSGLIISILAPIRRPDTALVDTLELVVVRHPHGAMGDTLGAIPASQTFRFAGDDPEWRPYAGQTDFDLRWDGGLVMGRSDSYRLLWKDSHGQLERIVTLRRDPIPFTRSDRAIFMERLKEQIGRPDRLEQAKNALILPDAYPYYRRFICGPRGSLWLQKVQPLRNMSEEELEAFPVGGLAPGLPAWDVFDGEGRYLGVVEIPLGIERIALFVDHVFGVYEDELDVQHVIVFDIDGLPLGAVLATD